MSDRTPNQYEDDRLLRDCLQHGEITTLGARLGIKYNTFARQINPDDHELKSPYHFVKLFFFQALRMRKAVALTLKADLDASFEAWNEEQSDHTNTSHLVGDVATEVAELVCARLNNKPIHEQRKEAFDALAAVQQFINGLDAESRLRQVKG